jgi:DNA-binding NarL/FixJ family response regulator
MRVLALVPDLMDRSRLTAALGGDVELVATVGHLTRRLADTDADAPETVVVDVDRPGVLDALATIRAATSARLVAFGAHVERDRLAAAKAAGCDQVLARSAFFANLSELTAST